MNEIISKTKHGYVISDLHIFAKWSSVDKYMSDIRKAASDAAFFVFNGDIFDFRWTVLSSAEETAKSAIKWFAELCSEFPECQFYYVLGNHDCHVKLLDLLTELAEGKPNFHWYDSHIKIGPVLFMHGDLIFKKKNGTPFKRKTFNKEKPRSAIIGTGYHLAIMLGAHSLLKQVYAKEKYARYVIEAVRDEDPKHLDGVKEIYLGHTHVSFSDFEYNGIIFHNTGSAVHDLHCNMMKVSNK